MHKKGFNRPGMGMNSFFLHDFIPVQLTPLIKCSVGPQSAESGVCVCWGVCVGVSVCVCVCVCVVVCVCVCVVVGKLGCLLIIHQLQTSIYHERWASGKRDN